MSDKRDDPAQIELPMEGPLKDYSAEIQTAPARVLHSTDQIIEEWFDNHIRGSIVGQNTSIYNHVMVCKDKLKAMLRK